MTAIDDHIGFAGDIRTVVEDRAPWQHNVGQSGLLVHASLCFAQPKGTAVKVQRFLAMRRGKLSGAGPKSPRQLLVSRCCDPCRVTCQLEVIWRS
jgi:hypothetical protein